jgi:hypothetical protein
MVGGNGSHGQEEEKMETMTKAQILRCILTQQNVSIPGHRFAFEWVGRDSKGRYAIITESAPGYRDRKLFVAAFVGGGFDIY